MASRSSGRVRAGADRFRGRGTFQAVVLAAKMFPIAILAIPLAATLVQLGLYDSIIGVALVHAAIAMPFVILIVGGVFVAVSRELEEAAETLGSSRWGAFARIAVPPSAAGLARRDLTFHLMNYVFAAST